MYPLLELWGRPIIDLCELHIEWGYHAFTRFQIVSETRQLADSVLIITEMGVLLVYVASSGVVYEGQELEDVEVEVAEVIT